MPIRCTLTSSILAERRLNEWRGGVVTHASLFSGIGGFDLAAEWAGWANAFNCEINAFLPADIGISIP